MSDPLRVVRFTMRSLVGRFGCHDAVAAAINARWGTEDGRGRSSKGTISKKLTGQLDWTINEIWALEDAVGEKPISRLMARRLQDRPGEASANLMVQSGAIAKECGEAIAAILAAEQSSGADDAAAAITEINEAVEALRRARDNLEARVAS